MTEYLINCGGFNIVVVPARRSYYVLDGSTAARRLLDDFLEGRDLVYDGLQPRWFQYGGDEVWHSMDGVERRLGRDIDDAAMIDLFVQKKHNFGSLVAVRDGGSRKVKVFKRERLAETACESA